jgi:SMI1-KNR4 cell-wall
MNLTISEKVASPITKEIVEEYECQIKLQLPRSYREFLIKCNGGHPSPDYFDLPNEGDFPAQFRYFYGLDADEWSQDAWAKFKFFDSRIPFGLLMIGEVSLECAELCFDFRKFTGTSINSRVRGLLFGNELLDSKIDKIPVKFLDWRHLWETGKYQEKDLFEVAEDFESFVKKLRNLTDSEEAAIDAMMPTTYSPDYKKAQSELDALAREQNNVRMGVNRPPKLADLVRRLSK